MTVYFSDVEITNYRSCVSTRLQLTPFTALVGRNNCGKSNCLNALQWLVRKSKLQVDDFNDITQPVMVIADLVHVTEADLDSLGAVHRRKVEAFVVDQTLRIKRTQSAPGQDSEWTLFDFGTGVWAPNPGGIDNAIVKLFPDPIRIGAMENAEEDASKSKTSTTIGKLLALMVEAIQQQHEAEIDPFFDAILGRISAEGGDRFASLDAVDDSINGKIGELFPGMRIKLDFSVPTFKDLLKDGTVRVYEGDGIGRSFSRYGHGAQRAIQMAMVRHLADLRRAQGAAADVGGATLLLVDEPELFMHPFAIEQVREAMRSLSASGYQVVFSTHSGQMILAKDAQNALLLRKSSEEGTQARQRLKAVVERFEHEPTPQAMHLFTLSNASQILFADFVLLTEGKTELRLLPAIHRLITGNTLGQAAIALVAMGGRSGLKKTFDILQALGLPSQAIVDLDYALTDAVAHGFVAPDDENLVGCKAVFERLAAEGRLTLNPENGLPRGKGGIVSAAAAYELLAQDDVGAGYVVALSQRLRMNNIWVWTRGAIEAHLGLDDKTETAWVSMQMALESEGVDATCPDAQGVRNLIAWVQEGPAQQARLVLEPDTRSAAC